MVSPTRYAGFSGTALPAIRSEHVVFHAAAAISADRPRIFFNSEWKQKLSSHKTCPRSLDRRLEGTREYWTTTPGRPPDPVQKRYSSPQPKESMSKSRTSPPGYT
jgi:hypothetical protein